jgi:hypothetical protein
VAKKKLLASKKGFQAKGRKHKFDKAKNFTLTRNFY